jgi:hypothetical protein
LTASDLAAGFQYGGERIPLISPQRGIFKPTQMKYLLSIKTVFPRPGGRVRYDDQRDVHQQIFAAVDTIGYAFMGTNPRRIGLATGTSQRNRAAAARFREASRARAPDSPCRASAWTARTARPTENCHAMVPNGIPLSKIHHAAFDAHLIGIDPDYRLHVSPQLLDQNDGPMLEGLKKLEGVNVHLPRREKHYPDRERLASRFEQFRAAY